MRRYTLVLHHTIGPNWQIIEFKRVECNPTRLAFYKLKWPVHFILSGWPMVKWNSGDPYFKRQSRAEVAR